MEDHAVVFEIVMVAVAPPVRSLQMKLYIPNQQSAADGNDSAREIGAAVPVFLARVNNLYPFAGASDQALRRNQLSGPDAD